MRFADLLAFVTERIRMSHIYQPLLIRALVDAGGAATLRQLAHAFLAQDESQLRFYEKRIKEMPLRVLAKHGVVTHDGPLVSLAVENLTYVQRAQLKMACEQRLQEFVQKRNLGLWEYRLLDLDPVPDNLRYQVLKETNGRCALCGITTDESPLDVDHIIPRSRDGKTVKANLQALCAKCNRTKGNKDTTDFRGGQPPSVTQYARSVPTRWSRRPSKPMVRSSRSKTDIPSRQGITSSCPGGTRWTISP